ncbi:hypothetical protein PYW08_002340 [Mythimna loreyi]|uniref:Uncharacterized protein n=1 Tax=Mythimna loreyi TaxID=667449 RepID=A0ACC2R3N1_9NEOP|nr:hypothetical protein PYW08_002340 [Mythimna loreyi]
MSLIKENTSKIKIRTCRICLDANSSDMVPIEEENGWLSLFEICFGFALTIQDVPRLLCQTCAEKVQSYIKFKEKCRKSHNLWKLVISDVKCYITKHDNFVNATENTNETVATKTEIKDEEFDLSFDSDHFSNYDGNESITFSPIDIKMETQEEYTKSRVEENNANKNDCLARSTDNSKQMKNKSVNGNSCAEKTDQNINSTGNLNKTGKKIYTCSKCKETYERKAWYDRHKEVCRGRPKIRKKIIYDQEYSYDLGRKYEDHNIDKIKQESQNKIEIIVNESDTSFPCGLCHLSFASAKDGFIHLNDHWSSNELTCNLCDFVGIDLAAIICHRYSHVPRNKARFACHICKHDRYSLMALHFHYRKEHLKKAGGYCSRCNTEYDKLRYWKRHERRHVPPKYICDMCTKGFFFKSSLEAHIIDHMRLVKGICDICGIVLSRQRYIKTHKEAVHSSSKPIKCIHCKKMYKNKLSLMDHQKRCAKEKTLKCEVCNKAFAAPKELKLHMICHSGEKPFKCHFCGRTYKRKSNLVDHLYKHNKMNMPQCLICMKPFSCPASLKRHAAVHTGVRRYVCTAINCEKSFNHKKQMMTHIQLRHKNEVLEKSEVLQEEVV